MEPNLPEQLLSQLTSSDLIAFGVGALLLVFGRKLFFLSIGAAGFLLGLFVSSSVLHLDSTVVELGLALLIGLAGAVLATVAQKIAVALAGFVLGGAGALWGASFFEASLQGRPEILLLVIALAGAVLGTLLAPALFNASLAGFTSFVGATLITTRADLGSPHETWLFIGLLVTGLVIQTRGRSERRREARRPVRVERSRT